MKTNIKISALALAAAAFATTTLLAGSASAHGFGGGFTGHGPVVTGGLTAPRPSHFGSFGGFKVPPGSPASGSVRPLPYHPPGSSNPPSHGGGTVVSCHPGTGCSVTGGDRDRDHDGYHRGYDRNRWYGWRGGPEIVLEGGPGVMPVPVVAAGPAPMPAARGRAEGPCSCLTKMYMPDGSVVFQDNCTNESAVAEPQAVGAR